MTKEDVTRDELSALLSDKVEGDDSVINRPTADEGKEVGETMVNHENKSSDNDVQKVKFSAFEGQAPSGQIDAANLGLLLDVPLDVTVELGRTRKAVKDILELSQGSILELDKLAGEPVDILVNGKKIAKGEVVVIEENFGVRVTDIMSQADRLQKINS